MDEEKIISDGLMQIRAGILNKDFQEILDGYNYITDEGLELPKKKLSKLEQIRANVQQNIESDTETNKDIEEDEIVGEVVEGEPESNVNWNSLKKDQIVELLIHGFGVKESETNKKTKPQLIKLGKELETAQNASVVQTKKHKEGGWARGELKIVSVPSDPRLKSNKPPRPRPPKRDTSGPKDNSSTESSVRFYNKPPARQR